MSRSSQLSEIISDVREYVLFMKELGIDLVDAPEIDLQLPTAVAEIKSIAPEKFVPAELPKIPGTERAAKPSASGSRLSKLPSLSKRESAPTLRPALENVKSVEMPKPTRKEQVEPTEPAALFDVSKSLPEATETIADIHHDIGNCTRCPLWEGRTQIVHSKGNLESDLMFVGEAPGADEDEQGAPFVGRAGQLLTKIIEGIGLKREEVFIGNINRCRPPGNRAPTLPEAETCKPFLLREITIVRPKVIVVMGNTATQNLLNTKVGITRLRGEFQDYFGVKVMPTFHPAYLLRDPHKKREVWEDMKKVRDYLATAK
jgi:uracil-DNA glycosylase family 4